MVGHSCRGTLESPEPHTCMKGRAVIQGGAPVLLATTPSCHDRDPPDLETLWQAPIKARLPLQPHRVWGHAHDLQSQWRIRAAFEVRDGVHSQRVQKDSERFLPDSLSMILNIQSILITHGGHVL